jgi:hypothetical protein
VHWPHRLARPADPPAGADRSITAQRLGQFCRAAPRPALSRGVPLREHAHALTARVATRVRSPTPARTIDLEAPWKQARWLLHDRNVKPVDRVAGLLVLLYAQTPCAVPLLIVGEFGLWRSVMRRGSTR